MSVIAVLVCALILQSFEPFWHTNFKTNWRSCLGEVAWTEVRRIL